MSDFWREDLTEEEEEKLIDDAAKLIEKRRMVMPAILVLEMHKPLSNVAANTGVTLAPFLVPLFGFDLMNNYTRLLRRQQNVERLIERLEAPKEYA
jgi:hypothetical protein